MQVTLLGTGLMGAPMARNLARAGFATTVWNRSAEKAEPLAGDGLRVAGSLADAVRGADIILSILSDGAVVRAVIDAALPDLAAGALWVDMSSTKPEEARDQAAVLGGVGVAHLDAPVSGGTKGAEAATLAIMVGGEARDVDRATPVLSAMGRPVRIGPGGTGQLAKLANQAIVAITIGAVAEATLLAEAGGADPAALRDALTGGFADSIILQQHGTRMSTGNFTPGGKAATHLKDLRNIMAEARALGLTLPLAAQVTDRFDRLVHQMALPGVDHAGLYLELKDRQ